jgi:hypothetical protein
MNLPTSEPLNPPEEHLPPARLRRQRRQMLPGQNDDYAHRLDELGQRATPGVEFFLSALLSGMLFGVALLIDSPALAILAVLLAPFVGPVIGLAMASAAGSISYLARALASLAAGGLIYFLTGTLAGWLAQLLPPGGVGQTSAHLQVTWPDLALLAVGSAVTTYLLARSAVQRPTVSSIAVAYAVFLPLGAAGFALTSGYGLSWQNGLIVFGVHIAAAALVGMITFLFVGLRPRNLAGYLFALAYLLVCVLAVLPLAGVPVELPQFSLPALPVMPTAEIVPTRVNPTDTPIAAAAITMTPTSQTAAATPAGPSFTPSPKVATPSPSLSPTSTTAPQVEPASATPEPPGASATITPTRTLVPSHTPTETVTQMPTPVWARINAKDGNGAYIRAAPNYDSEVVQVLLNGLLIQVLPDVVITDGATWVKVRTATGKEGWIVRSLLATATPAPGW